MRYCKYTLIAILIGLTALPALAQHRGAKKDPNSLLTSARIALLANPPRFDEAMQLCREVIQNDGLIPEAYFRIASIYGEYATKEYDLNKKLDYLELMKINFDSTQLSCDNGDVKSKFKKKCKEFGQQMDSVKVFFWRDNYNTALEMITRLDFDYLPAYRNAADSVSKETALATLKAAADSTRLLFMCAITVDNSDYRPIEGIGITYDRLRMFDSSAYWFEQAYNVAPDSLSIMQNISYAYIQVRNWDKAIDWFRKYLAKQPEEIAVIQNIAICFNNKQMFDSAFAYNLESIRLAGKMNADSLAADAFADVGQYFLLKSQGYSDSVKASQQANDTKGTENYIHLRDNFLDSSAAYLEKAVTAKPGNMLALEQFGVVTMIRGNYDKAIGAFEKLAELEPNHKDYWINIGDAKIQMGKFEEAIPPFEKAVELDPGDMRIWEALSELYETNKMPDKASAARAKVEKLKKL